MVSKADLENLKKVELFQGLQEEELNYLFELAKPLTLSPGEHLFTHTDETDALYVITKGSLQLYEPLADNRSLTVFSKHEFIGETVLIAPLHEYGFSARALDQTQILSFDRQALLDCL